MDRDIERLAELWQRLSAATRVPGDDMAAHPAWSGLERRVARWIVSGDSTFFLQDADALSAPKESLVWVLERLHQGFPAIRQVAACTRSSTLLTLARRAGGLAELRAAGLSKVLVGVESGDNTVLVATHKGVTRQDHLKACRSAIQAGLEVGCYVIPGLGGRERTREHAEATADLLCDIAPQVILLRTLFVSPYSRLEQSRRQGSFTMLEDTETVAEIRVLLRRLRGSGAILESDYRGNLLPELAGPIATDGQRFDQACARFLGLPSGLQQAFVVARRLGVVPNLERALVTPDALEMFTSVAAELRNRGSGSLILGLRDLIARRLPIPAGYQPEPEVVQTAPPAGEG